MIVVSLTVASVAMLAAVAWMNIRSSAAHLAEIEDQLAASIDAKGKVLAENQVLALKGMVADNAFGEVDRVVRRVVAEDSDVVYGLFLSADGKPWAYYAPDHPADTAAAGLAPVLDLWKRHGIVPPPADATTARITHRPAFGQDVIEFAMPVRDGDDLLGSIHYGLSTQRLQQASEVARARSRAALIETLVILVALAIGTALCFLAVALRQASRITRPLADLTAAAEAIAGGRRDACVQIASGDELELLGGAFNHMVRDLDASYSQLEEMNRNLEQRVEQRTAELKARNRDMRLVLDNVDQGFITVGRNGIMATERSAVVDRWLGSYGPGTAFSAMIGRHDPAFAAMFELGLEAIRDSWMPLELVVGQLPRRLTANGRVLDFSYGPVLDNGALTALLVVAADVTDRVARERSEKAQRESLAVFESVMRDRRGFLAFFGEADQLVAAIVGTAHDADLPTLKRLVHTLKGNAAIFGLSEIAALCHDMESSMEDLGGPPSIDLRDALTVQWTELTVQIYAVIGDQNAVMIGSTEYERLIRELAVSGAPRAVTRKIAELRLECVDTAFARLSDKARALAARLGKPDLEVTVDGGGLLVDPRRWDRMWSELVHVIRNSVDHGIELADERESQGKPRSGRLVLQARAVAGEFVLTVIDDGAGIAWDVVAAKARARGWPAEQRDDLLRAVLAAGFSTRDQVTDTSGRGVGLDAVQQAVAALGGRIEIDSTPARGTTVRCVFPEDAMAGEYYREFESRLLAFGNLAAVRRSDSVAAPRVG
jgi:two-component system, chemotaxis family, sensor kinase CheA